MYKDGEAALDRILELVTRCPKELQETCFEALLSGYVQLEIGGSKAHGSVTQVQQGQRVEQPVASSESQVPPTALPRFRNTAKRLGVSVERLESLFDFTVDPFALHAVSLPGKKNAERARQVALLAAARSHLAAGLWSADWQEVKSLCVDYNCYDPANHAVNLKKGTGTTFKSIEPGKAIDLSSDGVKEAEKLLKTLLEETSG